MDGRTMRGVTGPHKGRVSEMEILIALVLIVAAVLGVSLFAGLVTRAGAAVRDLEGDGDE